MSTPLHSSPVVRALRRLTSPTLAVLVLVVGLAFQLRGLYQSGSIQGLPDTVARLSQPAWERGARAMLGNTFADYIVFVRRLTHDDSSVVLPPHNTAQPYAEVGLMQFFFYPRKVYNCGRNEAEACMYRARTEHTYVLAVPHFPPPEEALKYKDYVRFDEHFGLYVPRGASSDSSGH
jgi:hypothetical protein